MVDNISVISQNAIRIEGDKIIYFDPFKIDKNYNDADYIFITHSHYDHFSKEDINKVKKDSTKIIITEDLIDEIDIKEYIAVKPNNNYEIDDISFSTVPAYNIGKDFHKKDNNWVGYIVNIDNKKIYVAGDTDNIPELENISCDIAFVPVGGTYTMTYKEAASLIEKINPKLAIPTHYKTIVGTIEDAYNFKEELNKKVDVEILLK